MRHYQTARVIVIFGIACGSAGNSPPDMSVHLRADGVRVSVKSVPKPAKFGIAETAADEGGWFGEDCMSPEAICHDLVGMDTLVQQVHSVKQVRSGSTLFDNHFGGSLSYIIQSGDKCWTAGHEPEYFASLGCSKIPLKEVAVPLRKSKPKSPNETNSTPVSLNPDAKDPLRVQTQDRTRKPDPIPEEIVDTKPATPKKRKETVRCCKHCSNGQPCGNSCIPMNRTCRTIGGCACW